ncbi:ADP-ribose pyrophosphatase [Fulvivirga imtechensis AK7]|uniref:GDP-mannose pyrophosphatase n=1 Tax=Fulvivirga imtechensis AK7 TaxID=1237149 RepID=L8JT13_9BACT|nr:NUDIX hydrolase [Fulvivirga imtechensis]ELR72116.1 ADP-ribose pyrophosphatase [Fulvivirga imtechensis AK7]
MKQINNPWQMLSKEEKYDNPWINVEEHQIINPGGGRGIYGKVHFKNRAIGIVPLDAEGYTWIVGQYRYTLDEYSWEIPEGGGPMNEDPIEAAKRELKEETGLTAANWEMIMRFHTSNSVTDEVGFIYMATDLTPGPRELEESESDLLLKKLPFSEVLRMVMDQEITDSMSVAGILKVARMKGF